ncbi:MAG: ComEA family DNA-binding protein [Vicinamibacterales bacterium]
MVRWFLSLLTLSSLLVFPANVRAQAPAAQKADAKAPVMVNLNTATASELEGLPGIGASTAARIVEYRQKNGPFKKIEDLMNVQGIGEKSFLKLRAQITVAAKPDGGRSPQ